MWEHPGRLTPFFPATRWFSRLELSLFEAESEFESREGGCASDGAACHEITTKAAKKNVASFKERIQNVLTFCDAI